MKERKKTDREAFEKAWLEENLSQTEMAERFGISVSTVKTRVKTYGLQKTEEQRLQNIRKTMKARYGYEFGVQMPESKKKVSELFRSDRREELLAKRRKTNLERYGVENPMQNKDVARKTSETWNRKMDDPEFAASIREKTKATCLEKYGVDNPSRVEEFKQKRVKTTQERYGVDNYALYGYSEETRKILSCKENFVSFVSKVEKPTTRDLANLLGMETSAILSYLHRYDAYQYIYHGASAPENEVLDYITSFGIESEKTRKVIPPKEIDIYCPDYKVGIEFNGDYWRREEKLGKDYHRDKSQYAAKKGIFLYHIFEYEWRDPRKQECIKNQLKNLFEKNSRTIYARKCEIREVSVKERETFLDSNHVQGDDNSSVRYGLYFENELVSLMTFCKPRFSKKYDWELSRYCSKADCNVVGGASKLFKHFIETHGGTVVSYSDIAKTRGTLYEKLGFECDHISPPNYVWTNPDGDVLSRYQCQMKNETEIMTERGYVRVYGCGNKVWVYDPQKIKP